MASPRLGAPMQRKVRPQDGRPNTTQGLSTSWAPQRNARHVLKLHTPTYVYNVNARHVCNARHVGTSTNWAPQRNARNVRNMVSQTQNSSATKTSTQGSWRMDKKKFWLGGRLFNTAPPRLGAPTQRKASPQDGHPNATQDTSASWAPQGNARHVRRLGPPMHIHNANARHVRSFASWAPQSNARHVRKMGAQKKNQSATKTSTQGSTRLKDELEYG
jgi:hypothetical protein